MNAALQYATIKLNTILSKELLLLLYLQSSYLWF